MNNTLQTEEDTTGPVEPTSTAASSTPRTYSDAVTNTAADNQANTTSQASGSTQDPPAGTSGINSTANSASRTPATVYPGPVYLPAPNSVSPERPVTQVGTNLQFGSTFKPFPLSNTGLTFKPFSPVSKNRRTLQVLTSTLPAQPLQAVDIQKLHEAILAIDKSTPLPQREPSSTKRKRNLSNSPSLLNTRKPTKSGKIDSYFTKPLSADQFLDKTEPVRQQLLSLVRDIDNISDSMNMSITLSPPEPDWPEYDPTLGPHPWSDRLTTAPILNLATIVDSDSTSNHHTATVSLHTETHTTNTNNTPLICTQPSVTHRPSQPSDLATLLGPKYTEALAPPAPTPQPRDPFVTPTSITPADLPSSLLPNSMEPDTTDYVDLATLLGPKYSAAALHAAPKKQVTFQEPLTSVLPTVSHHPPHTTVNSVPTTTTHSLTNSDPPITNHSSDLPALLGQAYINASISNNTLIETTVSLQVPPTISIADTNSHVNFVSLQNRLDILPAALLPWRQARSFLAAQSKAECRAEHLNRLRTEDHIPNWALGLEALPGYLDRELDSLTTLRRAHAKELLQTTRDLLRSRARLHGNTGRASLLTCEILYRDEPESWANAKDLLAQLVGSDRAKCQSGLNKRREYLSTHPVTDEDIIKSLRTGPPAPPRRPNTRNRSRSRSPRRPRSPANRRDGPNRRPPVPRGNNAAPSASTHEEPAQPRMPKDSRGKAKNRGPNRSRGNQPQTSTSGDKENNRPPPQNHQGRTRRNLDLTPAELNLLELFRNKNGGQDK